jgi:hypothetical protein
LGVTAALLMPRDHNPQHSPTTAKLCNRRRIRLAFQRWPLF